MSQSSHQHIREALNTYLKALYSADYQQAYASLYQPDVAEFQEAIVEFAEQMDLFGETDDFLGRLKVADLGELKLLSSEELMNRIFGMIGQEIGQDDLKRMLEGTRITSIDETDYLSIVHYEIPLKFMDEWDVLASQVEMIYSENRWQILFKSGMRLGLQQAQREVDIYHARKAKDQLDKLEKDGYLTPVTLTGYANEHGEIIIEPRFKDGKGFSEGLAAVKIMRKYGYIDQRGEIAIKPRFLEAEDFHDGMAGVRMLNEDGERKWGFINKSGEMVIQPQYEFVASFWEDRCPVQLDDKWGYIDKKGNTVIPFKFDQAGEFWEGRATVEFYSEDGEWHEMDIDLEGNILPEE